MVSIILPSYNVERYIDKCIQSIINQTYSDWEMIIVDDGSTDGTTGICKNYAEKIENISYIRQENLGLGPARNTGLRQATGEWVTFIDSDDWVNADFLATLLNAQISVNADIVVCQYARTYRDSEEIDDGDRSCMQPDVYRREEKNFSGIFRIDFMAWGKLFRKKLFDDNEEVFPAIIYEDYASMPYYFAKANTVSVIKEALYIWRNRSGSLAHQIQGLTDRAESLNILARHFQQDGLFEQYREPLREFFLKRIYTNERLTADELEEYRSEFRKKEKKIFSSFYKKEFQAPQLYIYGSYLANVVGKILKCDGMQKELDDYYGFSSLIGLMNGGVEGWRNQSIKSTNIFRKKAVINELDTRFLKRTRTEFDDKDFVLIDFMDERFDIGVDCSGRYFTLSDAFLECDLHIECGYTVVSRFDESTQNLWKQSCENFIGWITQMIRPGKIILIRSKLAVFWGNAGKEALFENSEEILRINACLDECYDYFEEHCPGIVVIDGLEDMTWYFTQSNFKHGKYPWHLNWYAYKQIANKIIEKIYQ